MKTALIALTTITLTVLAGCNGAAGAKKPLTTEKTLLTVDFQKGQTLRYKFASHRDVNLDWDPTKSNPKPGKNKIVKSSEAMEMVVDYTPIEVDPYGLTTIKATCKSVKVKRSPRKAQRKDAVEALAGETFTFTVGPAGKIEDYSQLEALIHKIGKKAFRPDTKRGKFKEPDMIGDFITQQWFLWDSVSSIEKPAEGLYVGQTWKSRLPVPNPMVIRKAREVVYTLDEIRQTEKGQLALIHSSYSPTKSIPQTWPNPYSGAGAFRIRGTFGFLRSYRVLNLQGHGEELFNIDAGRIEQYNQQYEVQLDASLPLNLGINPRITIRQKLSMLLLED